MNQVLFWSVLIGMASVVLRESSVSASCSTGPDPFSLAIYVPGLNHRVFYQAPIGWEWGLVVGMSLIFVVWCELWKVIRRPLYRRWTPPTIQIDNWSSSEQASTVAGSETKAEKHVEKV